MLLFGHCFYYYYYFIIVFSVQLQRYYFLKLVVVLPVINRPIWQDWQSIGILYLFCFFFAQ